MPDMKHKRDEAAASMTDDDSMMVTGGTDGISWLSSTEIFTGGKWEEGPRMPVKMYKHCQVTSKKGVVVAGESFFYFLLESHFFSFRGDMVIR